MASAWYLSQSCESGSSEVGAGLAVSPSVAERQSSLETRVEGSGAGTGGAVAGRVRWKIGHLLTLLSERAGQKARDPAAPLVVEDSGGFCAVGLEPADVVETGPWPPKEDTSSIDFENVYCSCAVKPLCRRRRN